MSPPTLTPFIPTAYGGQSVGVPYQAFSQLFNPATSSTAQAANAYQSLAGQLGGYGSVPTTAYAPTIADVTAPAVESVAPVKGFFGGFKAANAARAASSAADEAGALFPGVAESSGALGTAGALANTLGPAALGYMLAKNTPGGGSLGGDILHGAEFGGGVGATIGLAGGPLDAITIPVGFGIGTIAGGVGGALSNLFSSDDKAPDPKETLAKSAQSLGLDPNQYTSLYDVFAPYAKDDTAKGQLAQQLAGQMVQDSQAQKQQTLQNQINLQHQTAAQNFALQVQAQAAQFMQPYTNNIISGGVAQADALNKMADTLPPQYANIMRNQAQEAIGSANQLAGAYAMQAQMAPLQYAQSILGNQQQLQSNIDYRNALAQQAQARALYYQQGGAQGQSSTSGALNQLLAGQGVTGVSPTG